MKTGTPFLNEQYEREIYVKFTNHCNTNQNA